MFSIPRDLGVQSWCFRHFKATDQLLAQVKAIGLARVELCGVHANFEDESTWEPVLAAFQAAGVQITSIGVQYFANQPAKEELWFKFARKAGAKMISASFRIDTVPEAYRTAERFAEKYDLVLGLHNHGGYDWLGSRAALAHAFQQTGPRFGLCMDTAWMIQAGENPLKAAEQFADRLFGLHVKDFTFAPNGKARDVIVGTGALPLRELLALVSVTSAATFKCLTLEYEGDVENPGPKLAECVAAVRGAV